MTLTHDGGFRQMITDISTKIADDKGALPIVLTYTAHGTTAAEIDGKVPQDGGYVI